MGVRISLREFARRDGCNDKLVRRGITEGRLPRSDDGKIDADLVGTPWRLGNASRVAATADTGKSKESAAVSAPTRTRRGRTAPVRTIDTPEQSALRDLGIPLSAISIAKRAHISAMRDQLAYDELIGQVVRIGDVAAVVGTELAAVRTRLLAIPAEHAPRIAMLKTPAEVQDALHALIVEALTQLTQDAPG